MSISTSLHNALSGLSVAARSAELVSANVANATTEGYGRRVLTVSASVVDGIGLGARGINIDRVVNQNAITERRLAEASLGFNQTAAGYFSKIETAIGDPGDATSLNARLVAFEAALFGAAAGPENEARLREVGDRAQDVTNTLNRLSGQVRDSRQQAEVEIASSVNRLNSALENIHLINQQIIRQGVAGTDVSALIDERQTEIDRISELVPVREIPREDGRITLITSSGATLVDDRPAQLEFTPTQLILPHMTRDNGLLSGVTLVGAASAPGNSDLALSGGKLEALFELRDGHTVQSQSQLDAFTRNLIERFESSSVDPSIGAGQAGLFTDGGANLDAANEIGLASRISLNALVIPVQGGTLSALRDGLYAPAGPPGSSTVFNNMLNAMSSVEMPASGDFQVAGSLNALGSSLLSEASQARLSAETRVSFASAQTFALQELEAEAGVDTDQEMQTLLLVEQMYAANARVIATVESMLQQILEL